MRILVLVLIFGALSGCTTPPWAREAADPNSPQEKVDRYPAKYD